MAAINLLENVIDQCNEGDCDAILMDRVTLIKFESAFRFSGLLSTTVDHLGPTLPEAMVIMVRCLIPMGYHRDERLPWTPKAQKVIGHAEAADGSALSGSTYTSIYAVKFGKDQLGGIQGIPDGCARPRHYQ